MIDSTALLSLVTVRDQESFSLVKDLERIFLTQTPKLLEQMYRGVELEKMELIIRAAHTLKTSCSYLGIVEMAELCNQIKELGEKDNVSFYETTVLIQKLERAYFESIVELKKLITNLGDQTNQIRSLYS